MAWTESQHIAQGSYYSAFRRVKCIKSLIRVLIFALLPPLLTQLSFTQLWYQIIKSTLSTTTPFAYSLNWPICALSNTSHTHSPSCSFPWFYFILFLTGGRVINHQIYCLYPKNIQSLAYYHHYSSPLFSLLLLPSLSIYLYLNRIDAHRSLGYSNLIPIQLNSSHLHWQSDQGILIIRTREIGPPLSCVLPSRLLSKFVFLILHHNDHLNCFKMWSLSLQAVSSEQIRSD